MEEKFSREIEAQQKIAQEKAGIFQAHQAALWELMSKFDLSRQEAMLVNLVANETILNSKKPSSEEAITSLIEAVRIQLEARRRDKPGMIEEYKTALRENLQT